MGEHDESSEDLLSLLGDMASFDDAQINEGYNNNKDEPKRKLPDWMSDPQKVEAEQIRIVQERRLKKEAFRAEAASLWAQKENYATWQELSSPPRSGRIICFDLETTGFGSDDSIIEIGGVELIDGYRTGVLFQSYAKSRGPIHPMAQVTHQITESVLKAAPPIEVCMTSFLDWVGNSPLVSHNISFDLRMLDQELARLGLSSFAQGHQVFCSLKYWRKCFPLRSATLNDLSAAFNVHKVVRRQTHGALVDSEILANCYIHLLHLVVNK